MKSEYGHRLLSEVFFCQLGYCLLEAFLESAVRFAIDPCVAEGADPPADRVVDHGPSQCIAKRLEGTHRVLDEQV